MMLVCTPGSHLCKGATVLGLDVDTAAHDLNGYISTGPEKIYYTNTDYSVREGHETDGYADAASLCGVATADDEGPYGIKGYG